MDKAVYDRIKHNFVMIRAANSPMCPAGSSTEEYIRDMKALREQIAGEAPQPESDILCCCIDTLCKVYEEGDRERVFWYCDAVHNICELFCADTWKYKDFWERHIKEFRRIYGYSYLEEIEKYFV